jgi:Excalibur calcium-binding domain
LISFIKKLIVAGMVFVLAFFFWHKRIAHTPDKDLPFFGKSVPVQTQNPASVEATTAAPEFKCDGRTRCSEMTSCEEARFFLKNCTGVKMDGDRDGLPCEDWCGNGR